ncbi:Protein of unknown function [Pyronema omphalodes CBS 100304]|uniref:Uncharacterized protein n=1 Tax=Pyronema omphalodes (strain CBS 100304) TaxID=1076935 RepID=U4L6J9_PYROM|nr:Protein of unknown function [Pyronema omphalodes CBS 100304]
MCWRCGDGAKCPFYPEGKRKGMEEYRDFLRNIEDYLPVDMDELDFDDYYEEIRYEPVTPKFFNAKWYSDFEFQQAIYNKDTRMPNQPEKGTEDPTNPFYQTKKGHYSAVWLCRYCGHYKIKSGKHVFYQEDVLYNFPEPYQCYDRFVRARL